MLDLHKTLLRNVYEKKIDTQVNMVSQSWDGKRLYFTSSVLGNWDKKGVDDSQYLKAYNWDGVKLMDDFSVDFNIWGIFGLWCR